MTFNFWSEANRASAAGREQGSRSDFTRNDKINLSTRTNIGRKKGSEGNNTKFFWEGGRRPKAGQQASREIYKIGSEEGIR